MNLSRPLMKVVQGWHGSLIFLFPPLSVPKLILCFRSSQAIAAMGFKQPTPIQKACVPVGLLGRDLCACAATGTGERLRPPVCHRGRGELETVVCDLIIQCIPPFTITWEFVRTYLLWISVLRVIKVGRLKHGRENQASQDRFSVAERLLLTG